jgi:hypothetical protein
MRSMSFMLLPFFLCLSGCDKRNVIGGPLDLPDAHAVVTPEVDASSDMAAGAGGTAPLPSDAGPEVSNPAQFPARIVFFYTPLGTVLDSWRPTVAASGDFSLTGTLQPLAPFKDRLLIVDGVDNLARPGVPSTDQNGPALLLTGQAAGESLGAFLGQKWGPQIAFPSVQMGVQSAVAIDFSGPNAAEPTNNNPGQIAGILFASRPDIAAQFSNTSDFAAAGRQQMDLVHLAIQYDRTRVLSLSWGDVNATTQFSWIPGVDKDYRALATNSGVAGPDRDHFIAVQTWFAQQFAYLINTLASTPEGAGSTLLDHTLLMWISETGEASSHTGKNIPVVIAGNLLGRFRTGAYVRTSGSQANLLSTISSAAGLGAFGDPALGNGPLLTLLRP